MSNIKKGDRVRAEWLTANGASLAGMQPKFGATATVVEGVVTHIRGDHPTEPTTIRIWVQPDEGPEVMVDPKHIVGVIQPV